MQKMQSGEGVRGCVVGGASGPFFGANIDNFSKYLRKKLTQNLTPQRPSSTKPGARFARANSVLAGPLLSPNFESMFCVNI